MEPIGYFYTDHKKRYEIPSQGAISSLSGKILLKAHQNFEQALEDLEGFEKIWLIFLFDRNSSWRPKVFPPRGEKKRGLFATRSPHRPNPIGLSCVSLKKIEGRSLWIENHDLMDQTPILDIKPYIPYSDSFPDAKSGWLEDITDKRSLTFSKEARRRLNWLKQENVDLEEVIEKRLAYGSLTNPAHRIKKKSDHRYTLFCKSWRIHFSTTENLDHTISSIYVDLIDSNYTKKSLTTNDDPWRDKTTHTKFYQEFQI